jgi:hypothetical protein
MLFVKAKIGWKTPRFENGNGKSRSKETIAGRSDNFTDRSS